MRVLITRLNGNFGFRGATAVSRMSTTVTGGYFQKLPLDGNALFPHPTLLILFGFEWMANTQQMVLQKVKLSGV